MRQTSVADIWEGQVMDQKKYSEPVIPQFLFRSKKIMVDASDFRWMLTWSQSHHKLNEVFHFSRKTFWPILHLFFFQESLRMTLITRWLWHFSSQSSWFPECFKTWLIFNMSHCLLMLASRVENNWICNEWPTEFFFGLDSEFLKSSLSFCMISCTKTLQMKIEIKSFDMEVTNIEDCIMESKAKGVFLASWDSNLRQFSFFSFDNLPSLGVGKISFHGTSWTDFLMTTYLMFCPPARE